jgi:hypothetical protein
VGGALFLDQGDAVALAAAFTISGAVTGTGQWLVLRRHLPKAGWWILATSASFSLFGAASEADAVRFVAVFVVVGLTVGIAQWLVLRQHLHRTGWWVLASTLGFAMFGVVPIVFEAIYNAVGYAIGAVFMLLIVSAYGGITGATLVWLLRKPAPK